MKFQERRKFHRISFAGRVRVELPDSSYDLCTTQNLSLTGLCVSGNFQDYSEQKCLICFVREDDPNHIYLKIAGKIAWRDDEQMGLEFTSTEFNHYMLLVSTLINNAEQPAIVLSEIPKDCPFEIADKLSG